MDRETAKAIVSEVGLSYFYDEIPLGQNKLFDEIINHINSATRTSALDKWKNFITALEYFLETCTEEELADILHNQYALKANPREFFTQLFTTTTSAVSNKEAEFEK